MEIGSRIKAALSASFRGALSLSQGRLLVRYFAARRKRLREVARDFGGHHLADLGGCLARQSALPAHAISVPPNADTTFPKTCRVIDPRTNRDNPPSSSSPRASTLHSAAETLAVAMFRAPPGHAELTARSSRACNSCPLIGHSSNKGDRGIIGYSRFSKTEQNLCLQHKRALHGAPPGSRRTTSTSSMISMSRSCRLHPTLTI